MVELLTALSIAAAAGLRSATPLLLVGLMQGEQLWQHSPLLAAVHPQLLFGILVSWSLSEIVLSKYALGQRILQSIQLCLSPVAGAIVSLTTLYVLSDGEPSLLWIIGTTGALFALVLQLVQTGWAYRLKGLPLWGIWLQDGLCFLLVVLAFGAPKSGGLIALVMLWLAIRSAAAWRRWQQASLAYRSSPSQARYSSSRRRELDKI